MGIRGTVRRSVDGRLVHTNVRPPEGVLLAGRQHSAARLNSTALLFPPDRHRHHRLGRRPARCAAGLRRLCGTRSQAHPERFLLAY